MMGGTNPGVVGVALEELPRPPFGSDYRMKVKLQSLFMYCYTKAVVSAVQCPEKEGVTSLEFSTLFMVPST